MSLRFVLFCVAIFVIIQAVTYTYARPEGEAQPTTEDNIKKLYEKALADLENAFGNIKKSPLAQNLTKIFNDLGDTITNQANQLASNLNAKPAAEN